MTEFDYYKRGGTSKEDFFKLFKQNNTDGTATTNTGSSKIERTPLIDAFEGAFKEDNAIKKSYNNINNKLNNITKNYKKLKANTIYANKIDKEEEILNKFVDNKGNNLFENLIANYDKDYNESTEEIAKNNLYDSVIQNDLDPEKELALTFADKCIFIVIIFIIRLVSIYITYYYIDGNIVNNISRALFYYSASYLILFFIIVVVINADVFRLRMMFNYLNMHVNLAGIFVHLIIKIIVVYLVYLLILNITSEPVRTTLSSNEKRKLKYKLDMLTLTIIIFMIVFVLVL